VTSATVGAVLVTRRPRHPVGWLLLGLGASMIVLGAASDHASYALLAGAGPLPWSSSSRCSRGAVVLGLGRLLLWVRPAPRR
jgi:hypothetical protein